MTRSVSVHAVTGRRPARAVAVVTVLLAVALVLGSGCEWIQLKSDGRSTTRIKEEQQELRKKLDDKKAERDRVKAQLIAQGFTEKPDGDLKPPRGWNPSGDASDQMQSELDDFRALNADIAGIQGQIDWNRRVWEYRGRDVANLSRAATTDTTTVAPHIEAP